MKKQKSFITLVLVMALSLALIFGVNELLKSLDDGSASSEYSSVYPDGKEFKETSLDKEFEGVKKVIEVTDGSSTIGYVFDIVAKGYGGDIEYRVGIATDGIVQGFEVLSHSETEGFGAAITQDSFKDGVKGVNLSTGNVSHGAGNKDTGEIAGISGATVTTNAITDSLKEAVNALSTKADTVKSVESKIPYHIDKWEELFGSDISNLKFEEFEDADFYKKGISRIIRVKNNDEIDSYLIQAMAKGYGGNIEYILRVDRNYKTMNVAICSHNETPKFGAEIESDKYKDSLKNKNLDKNLFTKSIKLRENPKFEKDILLITGATVTSNAMKKSLDLVIDDLVRFDSYKNDDSKYKLLNLEEIKAESNVSYNHKELFEGIEETEAIEEGKNDNVVAISKVLKGGKVVGKIYDVNVKGFAGKIEYGILVSNEGKIEQFVIYKHSETEGYGAGIAEQAYKDKIVGADLNSIEKFEANKNIEAISGATITTNAMIESMNKLLESYAQTKDIK